MADRKMDWDRAANGERISYEHGKVRSPEYAGPPYPVDHYGLGPGDWKDKLFDEAATALQRGDGATYSKLINYILPQTPYGAAQDAVNDPTTIRPLSKPKVDPSFEAAILAALRRK